MMKYLGMLFVAIALVAMPSVAKANLLTNPGFESDLTGWNAFTGAGVSTNYAHGGVKAMNGWADGSNSDQGAFQEVAISAGTPYSFTGYLLSPNGSTDGQRPLAGAGVKAFLSIEWVGGSGGRVDSAYLTGTTNALWNAYSVSGTAPSGATNARFVAKIERPTGTSGDVYFDDLNATAAPVPEPTSMLLLGSGLLGLFGISRKKK